MNVCTVVGARPQFVKLAPLSRALAERGISEVVVDTGQHYDYLMSEVFFRELGIEKPDHSLAVGSGSHGEQTGTMLAALEGVFESVEPDLVIVFGDTNSTLAGAIAAKKLGMALAHVEAGLRSFNRDMPEEINRIMTDSVSDLLFAPSESALHRLLLEGHPRSRVFNSGDVMFDVAIEAREVARSQSDVIERLELAATPFVLATVHRPSNTDDPERLRTVLAALDMLSADIPVVLPLHPRTSAAMRKFGLSDSFPNVRLTPPQSYLDMVRLETACSYVVTDSGGVQREAYFHGKPAFVLREETEWVELVEAGWTVLAPETDARRLATRLGEAGFTPDKDARPYGSGKAAEFIGDRIRDFL